MRHAPIRTKEEQPISKRKSFTKNAIYPDEFGFHFLGHGGIEKVLGGGRLVRSRIP
jgi:hypothetical protein